MTRKICGYYGLLETAAPSEQTFECAARNLDLFFFVGTLERMAESLCALRHLLNWNAVNPRAAKAVATDAVLNPSRHSASAAGADVDDLIQWDLELYGLAEGRLDDALRHQVPAGLCGPAGN